MGPQRAIGDFAGGPNPNDWDVSAHSYLLNHCCTANGPKVLYWIWERRPEYKYGKMRINLLLNRASKQADVDGCIAYQGRVDVRRMQVINFSMRIPEWVTPSKTRCELNDNEHSYMRAAMGIKGCSSWNNMFCSGPYKTVITSLLDDVSCRARNPPHYKKQVDIGVGMSQRL